MSRGACCLALLALGTLAACQGPAGLTARLPVGVAADSPTARVASRGPSAVYADLARRMHACWLNPRDPLLENHTFFAEAKPGGRGGGDARITIHRPTDDGERGLRAVTVDLTRSGTGTVVHTQNHRLAEPLATRVVVDVNRWARGDLSCGPRG